MRVATPVEGFSGVVANVEFVDGVGESDDANALNYFRRHGYTVGEPVEDVADDVVEDEAPASDDADVVDEANDESTDESQGDLTDWTALSDDELLDAYATNVGSDDVPDDREGLIEALAALEAADTSDNA